MGEGRHPGERRAAARDVAVDGGLPRGAPRSPRRCARRDPARVHRRFRAAHRPRGRVALLRRRQLRHRHEHLRRRWPGLRPLISEAGGTRTMRAALYYGPGDVRLEDIPEPDPTPGTVKVQSRHNGLCGTDLHQYFVRSMSAAPLPSVVGHECSGEVMELGEGVTWVAVGDLVAIEPLWPCGACAPCTDGDPNLCFEVLCHGLGGPGGGLSEFTVVREHMAHKLPEGLGAVHGAL